MALRLYDPRSSSFKYTLLLDRLVVIKYRAANEAAPGPPFDPRPLPLSLHPQGGWVGGREGGREEGGAAESACLVTTQ
jgi:hypothetical protein